MQLDKRDILADPVTAFNKYQPDADENEIAALTVHWQEAQSLQQLYNNIKSSTKILSREIGKAKHNNEPINQLMASMREQSAQLKKVDKQLININKKILAFFNITDDINKPTNNTAHKSSSRSYPSPLQPTDNVSILLLEDNFIDWNNYVMSNPSATIYHRAEWKKLTQKSYGHDCCYFFARDSSNIIVGILPLIHLNSRLFGDYLVSLPYFMHAGAIADHPAIEQKLMESANNHAATKNIEHIEYRDEITREDMAVRLDKVNMVLKLPESHDELWNSFTPKLRAQIKRPQRENPRVYIGRTELVDDFHAVYTRNMRDLGSPSHSKIFVLNILEHFPDSSWIIAVRLKNKTVAAGLLLSQDYRIYIPLASTIRNVNPLGINMLMYWEILKFAIDRGCTELDFGRSSKDSGTYRFKEQWGARPKQLYIHYWLNKGKEIPSLNPSNPKYAMLISIWKRLPVSLTRWIGPPIVKNLP